jgi:prolyl 4-hydroxylase
MDLNELKHRADRGDPEAQYELGARLLVGRDAPYAPPEAETLLQRAAQQGHNEALRLVATWRARLSDWPGASRHLQRAQENGDDFAGRQLEFLQALDPRIWALPASPNWRFSKPRIGVVESFLPSAACEWIIDRARPRLRGVQVNNPERGGSVEVDYRSNSGAGFSLTDSDVVLELVNARIAATINVSVSNQEPTNVLHYETGEEYRPHFDFIDPGVAQFARELSAFGQRTTTFLVYLNGDFEGGETDFPRLQWKFKGSAGDALVFRNIGPEGQPECETLHAGLPPTHGEKWLLSKWVRDRPLPLI